MLGPLCPEDVGIPGTTATRRRLLNGEQALRAVCAGISSVRCFSIVTLEKERQPGNFVTGFFFLANTTRSVSCEVENTMVCAGIIIRK